MYVVKYSINADSATLKKDLSFFVSHCLDELNVAAVIFYAGHAVQVESKRNLLLLSFIFSLQIGNENFLLPVDISSLRTSAFIQHCAGNISQTLMSLSICSVSNQDNRRPYRYSNYFASLLSLC